MVVIDVEPIRERFSTVAPFLDKIGLNLTGGGVDDPDQQFYENYACGSPRNYTGYCNPELERLFDRQSTEVDEGKRKNLVWEIERKLAEDGARPIIFYNRFAYCWQPLVKGWTMMVNSIITGWPNGRCLARQIVLEEWRRKRRGAIGPFVTVSEGGLDTARQAATRKRR